MDTLWWLNCYHPFCRTVCTEGLKWNRRRRKKIPYHFGHFFISIDTNHFFGEDLCRKKAGDVLRKVRASKKAPGAERIYTADEKEYLTWQDRNNKGLPISESIQQDLTKVRNALGLTKYVFPWRKKHYENNF
jgi:L-2-hydroxycarboxylate dehydrogenase (NAD+)